ncbi:MAG: glycerate kinase [Bacteroidales bacterium]
MLKILIAPDSFKESLPAFNVAKCLSKGIANELKDAEIGILPVSDGGEGFLDVMVSGSGGMKFLFPVHDALMRKIEAGIGFDANGKTAFIEMASASGLELIKADERNPLISTTFGTGELIKHAIDKRCTKILMGIGGSATNDGGAGMATALGARFLDKNGKELPQGGGFLHLLHSIDLSAFPDKVPEILVACDVSNPLTGKNGASEVYGPQKGATPEMVKLLDKNLKHFAEILRNQLNIDIEHFEGSGAAGGLGGGLKAFLNAKLVNGFSLVDETLNIDQKIADSDIVITAEGRMDAQTLNGKVPFGIAKIAAKYGKPVIGVTGTLGPGFEKLYQNHFDILLSIMDKPMSLRDALKNAPELLESTGKQIAHIIKFWIGNERRI